MLKQILFIIGWGIASFFFLTALIGLLASIPSMFLMMVVWGLIFLPPFYSRLTRRYGWKRNAASRLAAFFVTPIVIISAFPPAQQAQTPPAALNRNVTAAPSPSPITAAPNPTPSPNLSSSVAPLTSSPAPTVAQEDEQLQSAPEPGLITEPIAKPSPNPSIEPSTEPEARSVAKQTVTQATVLDAELQASPEARSKPTESLALSPQISQSIKPTSNPLSTRSGEPIRDATSGQGCNCPYDLDRRGNSCGRRSAYSRPGGRSPICYVGDQ